MRKDIHNKHTQKNDDSLFAFETHVDDLTLRPTMFTFN